MIPEQRPLSSKVSAPSAPSPLIARPTWAQLRVSVIYLGVISTVFYVFYGAASVITGLHTERVFVHLWFEPEIPFWPAMSLVYLSMNGLLWLSVLVLRDWRQLLPFAASIIAETLIASVFFVAFPIERAFPTRIVEGFWAPFFHSADMINLTYNDFPSLHVAFACTAAATYSQRAGRAGKLIFAIWALAITASTVLIHEHHLLDLVGGVALAAWTMKVVHPWAASPSTQRRCLARWRSMRSKGRGSVP